MASIINLDECTYNTIIKGFLNANNVVKALDYLDSMRSQGFAADATTASLFLGFLTYPNVIDADKALLQKYVLDSDDYTANVILMLLTDPNVSDADKALLQKYFLGRQG
ncbi:hypothetical protein RND81_09G163600 [Saponaria officinalis]|uniref:Pentatricopeptide repeat-containing protein n=1 Tax=Saponaria officinalis TaxID=3572 RepID=A0AAW1IML6_SAPOF